MTPDPKVSWQKVSKLLLNYGTPKVPMRKTPESEKTTPDEREDAAITAP